MKKQSLLSRSGRRGLSIAGLLGAVLLGGCGGGDLVQRFEPGRILAIGDENSVLTADGRNYSINGLDSTGTTIDCKGNPIWVQVLATYYNMGFAECPNSADTATPRGRILAAPDTGVAEVPGQIDSAGPLTGTDLVTIYAGQKDIIAAYRTMTRADDPAGLAAAEAAGTALALQVNRAADAGARVLVVTVPNVGATPFARAEKAAHADFDRAAALTNATNRFNARLRTTIYNDGRRIGLIQLDEYIGVVLAFPGAYGYLNVSAGACTTALPDCTSKTLVSDATGSNYLWADERRAGPRAQSQTGSLAVTRAANNPF